MKHLLDAHSLIWALDDPSKLGKRATGVLEDPAHELLVSVGTIWELSIKAGLGKLGLSLPYRKWMERATADLGLTFLPITLDMPTARWPSLSTTEIRLTGCWWPSAWWRAFPW